ncbi:MAG: SOS response transcriptional repressor [Nitrospira sp. LK70]|nr:SOS response transcriptional repressor [Nitrospira sp. LK70]
MKSAYITRQGQFLAYRHHYSIVNGCAPSEADMQRFFQVTAPSVHQMMFTLERRGVIRRVPAQARSLTVIVPPESLPSLQRPQGTGFKDRL